VRDVGFTARARSIARGWLPAGVLERYRAAHLVQRARKLARLAAIADSLDACCDAIDAFPEFRPYQQRSELVGFLARAAALHPAAIAEIGAASGGTLCALAHAARPSVVISIDIDFTNARLQALPQLGRTDQTIVCIAGDSHGEPVRARVAEVLRGRPLDLLFIDGDHSYAGVRADFEAYSSLVRPGGLIGFHDIVPDFTRRFGTPTAADSGGVPEFWRELAASYPDHEELIASPEQDGYGIGLLRWPGSRGSAGGGP
jgi:predicted O-methyltransferase YrrM